MKNAEAAIPVRGGSKKFEDWGVKNFRTGRVTDFWGGGVTFARGGQYPITCHE